MSDEQVAKYEVWAARLEANILSLARQQRMFYGVFFGFVALSALGFVFGAWLGVGTIATGIMVCIAGLYISSTRRWEYERELARTRDEIAKMKRGAR